MASVEQFKMLAAVEREWINCRRCPLGQYANWHVLYELPEGESTADILFIGEAPGRRENEKGRPFCGRSGDFLRETIARASPGALTVGFTNILACRPADKEDRDRKPVRTEAERCRPRVIDTINAIRPKAIVGLGRVPMDYLPRALHISGWVGIEAWFPHPAYLMRCGGREASGYPAYEARFAELFEAVRQQFPSAPVPVPMVKFRSVRG